MTEREIAVLADKLKPYIVPWLPRQQSGVGSGGGALATHDLVGAYHKATGLTTGNVLKALSATSFGFGAVQWSEINKSGSSLADLTTKTHSLLSGLTSDDHTQYVHNTVARSITAQHTFAPGSAAAPFLLNANAQGQTVIGLKADQLNKSVTAGAGLTGGGALTAGITLSMGTPSSLSAGSINSASGTTHAHEIDGSIARSAITIGVSGLGLSGGGDLTANRTIALASSSAPGAAASILASSASGQLTLPLLVATSSLTTPSIVTASGNLAITPAGTHINLSPSKTLQSSDYVSGWAGSGYRIDSNVSVTGETFAEFDNLSIRGTLSVYELLINQIRATNGTLIVSSAGKIDSVSGSNWTFEDPEGSNVCPFAVNDLVIIQNVDVDSTTLVKRVVRRVTAVSGKTITVTAASGGPTDTGSAVAGDAVVRFGNSTNAARQGVVLITSDFANSPYIDIVSGVTSWADWTGGTKTKGRFGLLSGLSIGSANEYGVAAGDGFAASNSYFKVGTAGGLQNNIDSTWTTGGTPSVSVTAANGIDILTFDASAGGLIDPDDYRVVSWSQTLGASTPDGALWTQRTSTKNEVYLQANQVSTRAGLIQLAAYGEAATGNYADTVYLTLSGAESASTRSYLNIRADDMEIDLGNGSANIGNLTLYSKQLLFSDGSSSDDGSATNPAYSFLNDANTGIYRAGADQLNFAVGGTSRLDITTTAINANLPIYARAGEGIRITGNATGAASTAYMAFYDSGGTRKGWVGDGSAGTEDITLSSDAGAVRIRDSSGVDVILVSGGTANVRQTGASAVVPTLTLTQSDLSEQFIDFITTVGAGNAVDTAAIGSYYGKARVSVNGTFKYVALYNS